MRDVGRKKPSITPINRAGVSESRFGEGLWLVIPVRGHAANPALHPLVEIVE
jgi:hypothetical protein